jgi:carboxyl-terminal processing protease
LAVSATVSLAAAGCRNLSGPPAPGPTAEDRDEAYTEIRLLTKAIARIRSNYVDEEKTGYHDLIHDALRGMMQSLDPHSQFMEPEAYREMKDETSGEYGGIGIQIGMPENALTIIAPMEDTPAYRAGLQAGDRIVEIDGVKTDGMVMADAVKKLRGEKGTRIVLKILRLKEKELREVELVREIIKVTSVKGTRMFDGGLGYIRITQFMEPTADALDEALRKLLDQGMKGLVLDLRNNPGGLLNSAIAVSSKFLNRDDLVVFTRGRGGIPKDSAKAYGERTYTGFPMVILVNKWSASASEIVAGALQDHKRAILVGERTFGKASVQSVFPLEDGSALRLTTAKYYTPSEKVIHEKGIAPDIEVSIEPDEWQKVLLKRRYEEQPSALRETERPDPSLEGVTDRQLERAVDVLKGILIFRAKD